MLIDMEETKLSGFLTDENLRKLAKKACNGHQHTFRYSHMLSSCFKMGKMILNEMNYEVNNPIVDICGEAIDLRKVERVSEVGGHPYFLSYAVYFTGGSKMDIYVEKMKREDFIQLWTTFNKE